MEIKKIEIKECDECPFNADTYIVSYKEVDDCSSFCTFYNERIGGERGDESMLDNDLNRIKPFPDFCKVREIIIKGEDI